MKRRLIAVVVAVVLAGVGGMLVLSYVSAADRRAMAGLEAVSVLVATKPIPEGTTAEALPQLVAPKLVPSMAVVPGTVATVEELAGRVATVPLQPGQQVLASQFADPATLEEPGTVKVPDGMQQVSIILEPQRVVGGTVTPGATVGLYVTMSVAEGRETQTGLVLQKVLVTQVQGGVVPPPAAEGEAAAPAASPGGSVLVTMAATPANVQKIVYAAENAKIWLSLQPADADPVTVPPQTVKGLYS